MNNFVPDKRYTMKRILFVYLFLGGLLLHEAGNACTSVIVSGKATPDGRPLMWKHRDTGTRYNHITFEKGEKYNFLGLANSDSTDYDIWTGVNEAGFAIMNTASFNLKDDDVQEMDHEGRLMRRALEICKNQQDFEHFLDTLSRPMRVEANFGIIDAYGGAAYYETNNTSYYKKDVNDPNLAPDGYLVYTNFSFEGRKDEGYGYIRYESAKKIFADIYPLVPKRHERGEEHGMATRTGFDSPIRKYGIHRDPRGKERNESGTDNDVDRIGLSTYSHRVASLGKAG